MRSGQISVLLARSTIILCKYGSPPLYLLPKVPTFDMWNDEWRYVKGYALCPQTAFTCSHLRAIQNDRENQADGRNRCQVYKMPEDLRATTALLVGFSNNLVARVSLEIHEVL